MFCKSNRQPSVDEHLLKLYFNQHKLMVSDNLFDEPCDLHLFFKQLIELTFMQI